MSSLPVHHGHDQGILDAIRPETPRLVSDHGRRSSGSSGDLNEKKGTSPEVKYDADPEKQSERVGSLEPGPYEDEVEERPRKFLGVTYSKKRVIRDSKRVLLAAIWIVFTVSVLPGVLNTNSVSETDHSSVAGGSMAPSSTIAMMTWDG